MSAAAHQTRGKSLLGGMPGDRPRSGGLVSTLSPFCSNMARRLRTPLIVADLLGGTARESSRAVSGRRGARDGDGKSGCCDGYGRIGLGGSRRSQIYWSCPFLALPEGEGACRVGASPRQDHGKANRRFKTIKSRVERGQDAKLKAVVGDANEETKEGVVDTRRLETGDWIRAITGRWVVVPLLNRRGDLIREHFRNGSSPGAAPTATQWTGTIKKASGVVGSGDTSSGLGFDSRPLGKNKKNTAEKGRRNIRRRTR